MAVPTLSPCSLPARNPLRSFWLCEPSELADHRTTGQLPRKADVIIIGSGIAGTLTAYNLLQREPHLNILMLEAREVCGGATGRNGGQIKTDPYIAYPGLKERVGARKANEVLKFESSHLDLYKRLLDKEQIPCDFHITTAFDLCLNDRMAEIGRNAFHERQRDWPEDMKAFLEIEGEEHLERLSQAKDARWGCAYKVGSVHPYKLVNGVLRRCFVLAKNGGGSFNLQTHTPVTHLDHSADGWTAVTERGNVTAPKVVVCANGYVSHLLPEFANKIIPLKGACSALAIPPVQPATTPSNQVMRPLFTTYSLKHDEHDFDYMISRQEFPKHIVVGGGHQAFDHDPLLTYGNADDTSQIPGTEAYFKAFMPKHFVNYPEPESRLAHLWTGVMGYSHDGIPYCGPVLDKPKGLYMMGGFSGRGMVRAYGTALAMAELLATPDDKADPLSVLVKAGLPEAFLLTRERLSKPVNLLAEDPSPGADHLGSEAPVSDVARARL